MFGIVNDTSQHELIYEPLTQKYRPKTFEDMFGQQESLQIIKGMFASKKIARTFLLTGPYSAGKTTLARLIARYVNCAEGPSKACGVCPSCQAMDQNIHHDVTELDAASNRGIGEARELIARSNLAPLHKKRVFIIDECHALTGQAAEALLKTLEEPPPSTVFILCTTEPQKLKATIRSRCTSIKLNILRKADCTAMVQKIAGLEAFPLTPAHAEMIAQNSYGHARVALHMLENVINYAAGSGYTTLNDAILGEIINKAIQLTPERVAEKYAENLLNGVADTAYGMIAEVENAPAFLERICYILRQYLVMATGGLRTIDPYFDQWFSAKNWARNYDQTIILDIYKKHLDAFVTTSAYGMDPLELMMKTAIESLLLIQSCPKNM